MKKKQKGGDFMGAGILLAIVGFILLIIAVVVFVISEGEGGCFVYSIGAVGLIMLIVGVIICVVSMNGTDSAALSGPVQHLNAKYLVG